MSLDKPRFRRDLEAVPLEEDGQRYVEVRDPVTGGSFRLYDSEYRVALAFDGLAFDRIIPWLRLALGLELDESVLREFAGRLHELGFLEPDDGREPDPVPTPAVETAPSHAEEATEKSETNEQPSATPEREIGTPVWEPARVPGEIDAPPVNVVKEEALSAADTNDETSASQRDVHETAASPPVQVTGGLAPTPSEPAELPEEPAREEPPAAEEAVTPSVEAPKAAPPVQAEAVAEAEQTQGQGGAEIPAAPETGRPEGVAAVDAPVVEQLEPAPVEPPTTETAALPEPPTAAEESAAPPAEASGEDVSTTAEAGKTEKAAALPGQEAEESAPSPSPAPTPAPSKEVAAPPPPAEARRPDSTAFPVLPSSPVRAPESPPPAATNAPARPPMAAAVTPTPVRPPPLPFMTPPPITLPPLPAAQMAALRRRQRRSLLVFGSLGVVAAVAVLAVALPFFFPTRDPLRAHVHTLVVSPGTVYRYFPGAGAVSALPGPVLKFPAAGKVTRIAKTGSQVAAGDIVAAVEAARPLQDQLAHQRERLAFYQQMAEAMHQVGNTAEEERQAANVEVRKARVAKALSALAAKAVVASSPGVVEETFSAVGDTVEAGSLALRLRPTGHRATFDLPRAQADEARRLGFCQIGVKGYVLDCSQAPAKSDNGRVVVDIPSLPTALLGQPAHLARARFDGAVVLPASCILNAGRRKQVLVVLASGRVESRPVTVAEENASEAIVVQGLDAGENVILAPMPNLRPGARVSIRP